MDTHDYFWILPYNAAMCTPCKPYDVTIKPEWRKTISDAKRKAKTIRINREYDVPYLAGPSNDGMVVYIDRHVPKGFMDGGRMIQVDRYLTIHECVEEALMQQDGLPYFKGKSAAHKIATDMELAAIKADGVSATKYNAFMNKYVKEAESDAVKYPPPDLFEKPYQDEHDTKDIKRLNQTA